MNHLRVITLLGAVQRHHAITRDQARVGPRLVRVRVRARARVRVRGWVGVRVRVKG